MMKGESRIKSRALSVIGFFVTSQFAVYGLPEQCGKTVLGVLAFSNVTKL
jgi:hypothetical protein